MTTTELIRPPRASSPTDRSEARPAASASPTFAEVLDETLPLVGVIPVAGPPAVLLVGPLVLFALLLVGPFALLVTLAVLLVAAWALVALIAAILASPYLLVRHLRARWSGARSPLRAPAPRRVRQGSRRIPLPVRSAARVAQEG
jgi:hypothetical protein